MVPEFIKNLYLLGMALEKLCTDVGDDCDKTGPEAEGLTDRL